MNRKNKLGGHTGGPFLGLERTQRTFIIQRVPLIEIVNSDRVGNAPTPADVKRRGGLDSTVRYLAEKHLDGDKFLVKGIMKHRIKYGAVQFIVDLEGNYKPNSEPRTNIPKKLISRYLQRERHALI